MKKEKTVKTAKAPQLVSYTIKATIPTCMYGNIQPEITVMAGTLEEAEKFVLPHINKLFADYTEEPINKRLRFITQVPVLEPAKVAIHAKQTLEQSLKTSVPVLPQLEKSVVVPPPEKQSEVLAKTLKVIESCKSNDTLKVIAGQIAASAKLTQEEIKIALAVIAEKNV